MPTDQPEKPKSYYDLLEVPPDSSDDDVRRAYRRLALRHHPDLHKGQERKLAELRFRLIHEAYAHLNTPQKRALYHERLCVENDNKRSSDTFFARFADIVWPGRNTGSRA